MKKHLVPGSIIALSMLALSSCSKSSNSASSEKSVPATVASPTYTLDMLLYLWIFDGARFNEFFNETLDLQMKGGVAKLPDDELERRRQYLRRTMDEMPSYAFGKGKGSDIILTISSKQQPTKEKILKSEKPSARGAQFSFVDEKKDRCEVNFLDRDHITLTIRTGDRAVVLPLIRTISQNSGSK